MAPPPAAPVRPPALLAGAGDCYIEPESLEFVSELGIGAPTQQSSSQVHLCQRGMVGIATLCIFSAAGDSTGH